MMKVSIEIPMIPPSPNVLRRKYRHFAVYKKLRDEWQKALIGFLHPHSRYVLREAAQTNGQAKVFVTVFHKRMFDVDNLVGSMKPILDALVNVGFLRDDDPKHISLHVTQEKAKEPKTVIGIEV